MSRISFFTRFENPKRRLLENTELLDETMETLSSGKKVRTPSDDPTSVTRLLRQKNQLDQIEQAEKNVDQGENFADNSESVLNQISGVLQRTRELAVQGSNDTLDTDARNSIADEVDQRLEQLVDLANTTAGNRHLFGGAETEIDGDLFSVKRNGEGEITEVDYNGDFSRLKTEVGEGQTLPFNLTGNEVFQATNQTITGGRLITDATANLDSQGLASTQGFFQIDETKIYYDTTTDSLNDIRDRINSKGINVEASVVTDPASGDQQLELSTRRPHEMFLKDFDRDPSGTPNQVEGLLNDLEIVGDGSGNPPAPRTDDNFPNSYHQNAVIEGKSLFDALVDFREAMQPDSDPDSGSIPKGNAQTNRDFDPDLRAGIDQALIDLESGIENVASNRSKGGALINRMETSKDRLADFQLNTKEIISEIEDANLAEVFTNFQRHQTVQQAALRMSSQIMSLTLANFV